jgi:hypothetical protein
MTILLCSPALAEETTGAEESAEAEAEGAPTPTAEPVAGAAEPGPADQLLAASEQLHQEHCSDATTSDLEVVSQKFAKIGPAWSAVNEQYNSTKRGDLLYWRGKLALCLGQNATGGQDLFRFVKGTDAATQWSALVEDATQQLEKLNISLGPAPPAQAAAVSPIRSKPRAPFVFGVGLAGAAAASFVVSAVEWQQALAVGELVHSVRHNPGESLILLREGDRHASASRALIGLGAGLAVGSAISMVASFTLKPKLLASGSLPVVVPTENGAALLWQARW